MCGWLGRLGLSHDYAALARVQHITGAVLLTMSPADWIFLGVRHSRDLRKGAPGPFPRTLGGRNKNGGERVANTEKGSDHGVRPGWWYGTVFL